MYLCIVSVGCGGPQTGTKYRQLRMQCLAPNIESQKILQQGCHIECRIIYKIDRLPKSMPDRMSDAECQNECPNIDARWNASLGARKNAGIDARMNA